MPVIDPLSVQCGCIQAPAGCGKTHLIADSLLRNPHQKPILVLTHTNAGVAALRQRLEKMQVPRKNYKLATIDGWAMRMVGMFPECSLIDLEALKLNAPWNDYPAIRQAALTLLQGQHIARLIKASYAHVFVDEYQDCNLEQHNIICQIAAVLPVCIFGDDLQGIFDFGGTPVDWNTGVLTEFPLAYTLNIPYRWNNADAASLGDWLLGIRQPLLNGQPLDLREAPNEVDWVSIVNDQDFGNILNTTAALPTGFSSSLIVCDSRNKSRQQELARCTPGATVVENADLSDLVSFAQRFDFDNELATANLIDEAGKILRGLNATELKRRIRSLKAGAVRNPASEAELAILDFDAQRTPKAAAYALSYLNRQSGVSAFRDDVLRNLLKSLNTCASPDEFYDRAVAAREERRFHSRALGRKAVGSTLLLKGLEADQVVIVDTHTLNAKNLYVALTRGAKRVVVCSQSQIIQPVSN